MSSKQKPAPSQSTLPGPVLPQRVPMEQTTAIYRDEANERYRGNPLIEALPPVPSEDEAYMALMHKAPQRPENFRSLPPHEKIDLLGDLQQLFVPTQKHISSMQTILGVMRDCYAYRNPNLPIVQQHLYRAAQGQLIGLSRLSETGGGSNGLVLWGVTGAGKTSFLDRLQRYVYQQSNPNGSPRGAIYHELIQGAPALWPQLAIVRIQCQNTLKGTINALLSQIDEDLGTQHARRSGYGNRDILVNIVKQILTIHFVGLLIVEDVHKLKDQSARVLDYFCDIMEETGFPVLLVGTYKFRRPLAEDASISSKLTARGEIDFPPLDYSDSADPSLDDGDWAVFVRELWKLNVFTKPVKMPSDLPKNLYFHTVGVRRIARLMLSAAFRRSIDDEAITTVDEALLDNIACNELSMYQEPLDALRRRVVGVDVGDAVAARFEEFMKPLESDEAFANSVTLRSALNKGARGALSDKGAPASSSHQPSVRTTKTRSQSARSRKASQVVARTAEDVHEAYRLSGRIL